jgi:superfamily I DNA and/or RNA helicase
MGQPQIRALEIEAPFVNAGAVAMTRPKRSLTVIGDSETVKR